MTAISVGPGLRVDSDDALHGALGRRDEPIARTRDDVDGLAQHEGRALRPDVGGAVRKHRDRLRPADRIELVHPEQGTRRHDRRVRKPAVGRLRRTRHRDRRNARGLRRHDVHHDGTGVDGEPSGNVEAHPPHRDPSLRDARARRDLDGDGRRHGRGVECPHAPDGLLEGLAHDGVEARERLNERGDRNPQVLGPTAVESLRKLAQGGPAARADLGDDGLDRLHRIRDILGRPRHRREHLAHGKGASPHIDSSQHAPSLGGARAATPADSPQVGVVETVPDLEAAYERSVDADVNGVRPTGPLPIPRGTTLPAPP